MNPLQRNPHPIQMTLPYIRASTNIAGTAGSNSTTGRTNDSGENVPWAQEESRPQKPQRDSDDQSETDERSDEWANYWPPSPPSSDDDDEEESLPESDVEQPNSDPETTKSTPADFTVQPAVELKGGAHEHTIPEMDDAGLKSLKHYHGAVKTAGIQGGVQAPRPDIRGKVDSDGDTGTRGLTTVIDTTEVQAQIAEYPSKHAFGQRRFDITLHHRWVQEPNTHTRRWIPAGFDACTWMHLDPDHYQITGSQVVAVGAGGRRDSDDDLDWEAPEEMEFRGTEALSTRPGPSWCWPRHHVRIIYQGREWLLNKKSVAEVLTVLKATNAIPQRVIGYRNDQRVQRSDRLNNGDTLILMDVPRPMGQITIWCEMHWDDLSAGFKMIGEVARIEELTRTEIWARFHIEDARYWLRSKSRPFLTVLTDLADGDIILAKERRLDQQLQNTTNADVIRTVEVRMDQDHFSCTAPLQSTERSIRETLRTQYGRTDSTYTLKIGVCLCTLRQLEKGGYRVDVITTLPGGAPDPPDGWIRTKYRIADGEELDIYTDPKSTVE
jgi:hypothetical protein